jgi:ribosome biogenesis GTPase
MILSELGWDATLSAHFAPWEEAGCLPARVLLEHATGYLVATARGELPGVLTGHLRYTTDAPEELPAVGDWVAIRDHDNLATLHGVLPRRSRILRKAAGRRTQAQVLAANVDTVLLVMGLDGNYNLRRLERARVLAADSGADSVVILTKADLCDDVEARVAAVAAIAGGAPVHAINTPGGDGLDAVRAYLTPGHTLVLLGSSGVGKSTLLNALLGHEAMRTNTVRVTDDHGRHTTTHRQLVRLPGGAMIIDTPGLRELGLWGDGVDDAFPIIAALAAQCRFADCRHGNEPGCAVRAALDAGTLDPDHLASFDKLRKEQAWQERTADAGAARVERSRWKAISKEIKRLYKDRE